MLNLIFFITVFYLFSRYIRRMFLPSSGKKNQFNPYRNRRRSNKKNFDQIEDADFEDLSDNN